MHKPVKTFSESGLIKDDKDFIRLRAEFERIAIQNMKEQGCLPIYELGTHWSTWRDHENDRYEFKLTVYAWYAGRKKAQEYDFWCEGKLVKSG